MSQATIRAAIYNVVNDVSGTDNVYDYRRWAVTYDEVISIFGTSSGTFLGFDIEAGPFIDERVEFRTSAGDSGMLRAWTYRIRMYHYHNDGDGTEKAAATLIESVCDALNSDDALYNRYYVAPTRLIALDMRLIGGVLCHYAEVHLDVTENKT